jgi:hypothetical protein
MRRAAFSRTVVSGEESIRSAASNHPSAWRKGIPHKSIHRTVHMPRYSDGVGRFEHSGPEGRTVRAASSHQDADGEREGSQELRSRVCYERYVLPDTDVDMSRFEVRTMG